MASLDFLAEDILEGKSWARSWEQDLADPTKVLPIPSDTRAFETRCFDLASLTKVVVTGSLLVATAELDDAYSLSSWSEQALRGLIPELKGSPLEATTIRECWEHRSGLSAFLEFSKDRSRFVSLKDRAEVHTQILQNAIEASRRPDFDPKRGTVYSDLGHALLGIYLERRHASHISLQWESWKLRHLARWPETLVSLRFQAGNLPRAEAIATEIRHPHGELNDDNTFGMGGVASHAGLFGTALDLARWTQAVWAWTRVSPWARDWLDTPCPAGQRFVLGWDTPSQAAGSQAGGEHAPLRVRGHLGYTGTALWFDPQALRFGVLLTNRVHPAHTPENQKSIQILRSWCFESLWRGTLNEGWKTQTKTGAGLIS